MATTRSRTSSSLIVARHSIDVADWVIDAIYVGYQILALKRARSVNQVVQVTKADLKAWFTSVIRVFTSCSAYSVILGSENPMHVEYGLRVGMTFDRLNLLLKQLKAINVPPGLNDLLTDCYAPVLLNNGAVVVADPSTDGSVVPTASDQATVSAEASLATKFNVNQMYTSQMVPGKRQMIDDVLTLVTTDAKGGEEIWYSQNAIKAVTIGQYSGVLSKVMNVQEVRGIINFSGLAQPGSQGLKFGKGPTTKEKESLTLSDLVFTSLNAMSTDGLKDTGSMMLVNIFSDSGATVGREGGKDERRK